ncbi:MAG: hypothetical protein H6667_02450 [Ardenticatenaceae bacterium]|nr:hypothetical protein [Ardenticatenaceae bacterium]MCB9443371.1 hypothetical protein [Ardenticatenaceae bacterium]
MRNYERGDADHTPVLAMLYQIRTAVADLIVPLVAGLMTVWLVVVTPSHFFKASFFHERPLEKLRSPFLVLWPFLSKEERRPLDPAQFLLFGIFTAALAGFGFDNSNQLRGLLRETGVTESLLAYLSRQNAALGQTITAVQRILQSGPVAALQTFMDQSLIAAIWELIVNLFVTAVFAYIFYLLVRRQISPRHSYSFWLYMRGMQYFTTAVSTLFFSLSSLSILGLPEITPDILFWLFETALRLVWLFLFPAIVLPRLFPELTAKRVLGASLVGNLILIGANWLLTTGWVFMLAVLGAAAS